MYKGLRLDANGCIQVNCSQIGGNYHSSTKEKLLTFDQLAQEELATLTAEEKKANIIAIYRSEGYTFHTSNIKDILRLSLTGQDYICSAIIKRMHSCTRCGVYYKNGNKYKELWNTGLLRHDKGAIFLFPEKLKKTLKKVFTNVEITLGELFDGSTCSIAWQIQCDEGLFFIPWHNGCICPNDDCFSFTPKTIKELRGVYKALSFTTSYENHREYKTLFA